MDFNEHFIAKKIDQSDLMVINRGYIALLILTLNIPGIIIGYTISF